MSNVHAGKVAGWMEQDRTDRNTFLEVRSRGPMPRYGSRPLHPSHPPTHLHSTHTRPAPTTHSSALALVLQRYPTLHPQELLSTDHGSTELHGPLNQSPY